MPDPTLFDALPVAPARTTDPQTSHGAADAQTPAKVAPIRAAVLLALYEGARTDAELWARLGGPESSPRKRRGELTAAGLVEACGERLSEFGMPTTLWRLTETGHAFVAAHRDEIEEAARRRR